MLSLQFVCLYLLGCFQLYSSSNDSSQKTTNSENIFPLNVTLKLSQIILRSNLQPENYGNYNNENSKPFFSLQVCHLVKILCLIHVSKRLVEFCC